MNSLHPDAIGGPDREEAWAKAQADLAAQSRTIAQRGAQRRVQASQWPPLRHMTAAERADFEMTMELMLQVPPDLLPLLELVGQEVASAESKWPAMNSAHEAYGVLAEEFRELETHVFTKQSRRNVEEMRKEAIQVAAMAIRFVRDITDGGRARK